MRVLRASQSRNSYNRPQHVLEQRERFITQNKLLPLPRARHDSEFRVGWNGSAAPSRVGGVPRGKFGFRRGGPPLTLR